MAEKLAPSSRRSFTHAGRTIYEWDQTVDEVNIYVTAPKGVAAAQLRVDISYKALTIGIRGNPPYVDGELDGAVKTGESYWTLEDETIHIQLQKAKRAVVWNGVYKAHVQSTSEASTEDMVEQMKDRERLTLERFQIENPGFDFSGAEFNGACPDPSTFLGGFVTK